MGKYPTRWNLKRYFYKGLDDPKLESDFESIEPLIDKFVKKYKGKVDKLSASEFKEFFSLDAEISKVTSRVMVYLFYEFSLNTQNQEIIKKQGEAELKLTDLTNRLLFVSQEFKTIGYQKLIDLSKNNELKDYQNYFVQRANSVKHILEEKTEFALNLKENSGSNALNKLYEELTGSFQFRVNFDDEEKIVTEEEVRAMRMSPKEEVRKAAFESMKEVYLQKSNQITLGNIYNAVVKDWTSELKIRGYQTVLSQRNLSEEMPDEAVEILIQEVQKQFPLYHRYLAAKLKIMHKKGLQKDKDKIKAWNLYAPITKSEREIPFEEALELFLKTIKGFDKEFYDFSKEMFIEERVDVFPRQGKRGGAFASYLKDFPSFVLLNYTRKIRDIATIAHELGHATHGHLAQNQVEQVYDTGYCLAETASIFNEMLFSEAFLQTIDSDEEKLDFIDHRLNDIFATIFRQIMYASFEKEIHQSIYSGKDLTYIDFNKSWSKWSDKLHGQLVDPVLKPEEVYSWSAIPHIFRTPFYVYAYAFGNLLTFSLYEKYQEDNSFKEAYKEILRAGGSKTPYNLLIQYGLDITKPEFYQRGLRVVEDLVEKYEILALTVAN